ncbi:CorA family divalent cation transporter [Bacteriovorax sp. Seq25_V]|uniref:CorA family divalent cation transporter n=1 Tax=Bacteriovorax sp. Seq25_V TaxID=1201288 RepID=UPI00038A0DDE|nr:CorA family divalent cation transporter [Bacteriovorax sp. Seq25_V]EQC43836.1 putative magnesium and cobalt transport protein CorA [Bacteriovorax sp. Seq25_V]
MNLTKIYSLIKGHRFDSYLSIFESDNPGEEYLNFLNIDLYHLNSLNKKVTFPSNKFNFEKANAPDQDFRIYIMDHDAKFDYFSFFEYKFSLHDLTLDDIGTGIGQAKYEEYDHYTFLSSFCPAQENDSFGGKVSLLLFKNFAFIMLPASLRTDIPDLITLIESGKDDIIENPVFFNLVVLDFFSQGYFSRLNNLTDQNSFIEEGIFRNKNIFDEIRAFREAVVFYKNKAMSLARLMDVMNREIGKDNTDVEKRLKSFKDHLSYAAEEYGVLKGSSADMLNLYLAYNSKKTNDVMNLLTLVTSIFIPLSFITGLYGMNFDPSVSPFNMPELKWKYGYFYVLGLLISIAILMIAIFIYRGWLTVKKEGNE